MSSNVLTILSDWKVDQRWTLFLDRDGVINRRIVGGYVTVIDEFEFLPGVLMAMPLLAQVFNRIVIVSNQQGVGKGIMTNQSVHQIHDYLIREVRSVGGKIDRAYFSPYLQEENHKMRKPNIGMALQARKDFPDISFEKSIMVGDSNTDMLFARKLEMKSVFIGSPEEISMDANLVDVAYNNLNDFAKDIYHICVNRF